MTFEMLKAMKSFTMPVHFVDDGVPDGVFTCAVITICRSWDGSFYGEANVMDVCGPAELVTTDPRKPARVNGMMLNCPPKFEDRSNEHAGRDLVAGILTRICV